MTEQEYVSSFHNPDWRRSPDMWSRHRGEPYQRVSMGIGDAINLSAAAVYLAKRDGSFTWHDFEGSDKSIRSIFSTSPEVSVVTIPDWWINPFANQVTCHTLIINQEAVTPSESQLDMLEHIYASHGISYEVRWDLCPISKAAQLVTPRHGAL